MSKNIILKFKNKRRVKLKSNPNGSIDSSIHFSSFNTAKIELLLPPPPSPTPKINVISSI
jgi:hypothetical protein